MFAVCSLTGAAFQSARAAESAAMDKVQFNRDIRPILSDKCFACHGFDAKHRKASLRLDVLEGAMAEHDGGRPIVPGKPDASELVTRINSSDPDEMMPPPESHKSLSVDEKKLLRRWIEQGAPYEKHWAFEPPVAVAPPPLPQGGRNPIDAFIAARLTREGLQLATEADKPTLIRRVALALTGLPPKLAEVDAYLADKSADAYEKMVDRYLASPHYGEEMARHWLDVARYADTHGLHLDNEREMWAYRDWVVGSYNRNQPFDQFTIEQLAGDLLPGATVTQRVATGFNRCNVTTAEGGAIEAEFRFRYAVDRTATSAETWMGFTAGCAVCHDHKFDPLSQREFYSLYAFFNSAADPALDGNALQVNPIMRLETPEYHAQSDALDRQIAAKLQQLDNVAASIAYTDPGTVQPVPAAVEMENVWMEDEFPPGAQPIGGPGDPTTFIDSAHGPVFSGHRALKRTAAGLSQDYYEGNSPPLSIPPGGKLFAYVYLDPKSSPREIMLQFHKGGWDHRAVWGDYEAIDWGAKQTVARVHMGPLPAAGKWVRLEVPVEKLGLAAGDQITGFAFTQFGGTVYWDKLGVVGRADPAHDPLHSFLAWWRQATGKDTPGIPADLVQVARDGSEKHPRPEERRRLQTYYLQSVCVDTKPQLSVAMGELGKLKAARAALEQSLPSTFVFTDLPQPRDSFVMQRGAYDKPGEKVEPGVPAILPPLKKDNPKGRATRLDLARWLVAPEHPLTARVAVNRLWQQFFGKGLVKTSYDFGSQGEAPSHPDLLDWLALHFRNSGWDRRELVRLMLTSATFRQSSRTTPELFARDPENRLYARGPRFRLDAEQIRDNALFVSGLINLEIGGKGVKPYQPPNIWEPVGFAGSNTRFYQQDTGPALYRRSLYTFLKRTAPPPFMANFDAPSREQFCMVRERSDTPLQALQLMNDVQHVEAARELAQRMLTEGGPTAAQRITFAYRTVLARLPEADESAIIQRQLATHLARYRHDEPAARKLIAAGQTKPKPELAPSELAAYTLVASTILNLDETLNRN
jgi:hypothetical protein